MNLRTGGIHKSEIFADVLTGSSQKAISLSSQSASERASQVVKKERFESQIPEMSVSLPLSLSRTGNGLFCARYYLGC